jgi:hypothetical protein
MGNERLRSEARLQMKYWEIIARNIKKRSWSLGFVLILDSRGRRTSQRRKAFRCACGGKVDCVGGTPIRRFALAVSFGNLCDG